MGYQWIVQNRPDTDLIPTNIKDWVYIFGVEWSLVWWIWTLGVGKSINTYWSILTMPQYMIALNYAAVLNWWLTAFVAEWNYLCVWIWYTNTYPTNHFATTFYRIDLTTWAISFIWTAISNSWSDTFASMEYDVWTWNLYWNYNLWSWWYNDYRYTVNIAAGTISWNTVWHNHTWVTPPASLNVGWVIFSVIPLITGNWLRTANSGNDQVNRTGIQAIWAFNTGAWWLFPTLSSVVLSWSPGVTIYYYQMWNLFIFTHGKRNDLLHLDLIRSSANVRNAIKTALWYSNIDDYKEDTTSYNTWTVNFVNESNIETVAIDVYPRLVAMLLS